MATTPDAPLQNPSAAAGAGGASAFRQRIEAGLARLSNQQKLALIVALAAVVVLVVGSVLYGQRPDYKVLFSNLSEKDGGTIITALEQMQVPYRFSEGGGAILVPAEKVHEARLRLATQGLPRGGTIGFELLENQKFGITQFAEQVNYQRALEGELARTIQTVAAVQMAMVDDRDDNVATAERLVRHPTVGKYIRRTTKLLAHDEAGCREGDIVSIVECRPISRRKSWRVAEILQRAEAQ